MSLVIEKQAGNFKLTLDAEASIISEQNRLTTLVTLQF
jgi:hypothetical protein